MASINTDLPPSAAGNDSSAADSPTTPNTPSSASARPRSAFNQRLRSLSKTFEESDLPEGFLAATSSIASSVLSTPPVVRRRSSAATAAEAAAAANSWLGTHAIDEMAAFPQELDEYALEPAGRVPGGGEARGAGPMAEDDDDARSDISPGTTSPPVVAAERAVRRPEERVAEVGRGTEEKEDDDDGQLTGAASNSAETTAAAEGGVLINRSDTAPFDNGYHFPPSRGFVASFKSGAVALWKFAITPFGFLVVLYGLLVVAFGGQIFLLLCNAAPAMCHPDCNDINSPRRKWIEYDSQILNALFCVTGFGLAPWRFRDLYFLMRYRVRGDRRAWEKLAGINRGWFRLAGSENLPSDLGPENVESWYGEEDGGGGGREAQAAVPFPITKIPDAPLTGCRAPATKPWKMDTVIWANCMNTVMQAFLAGFMWGMNRYDRPSWTTGLFVGLAIVCAAVGGLVMFFEGKKVKGVEGVPLTDADREQLARDKELSIPHYNNIKDKKPKPKKEKKEKKEKSWWRRH